jgi:hypothetical protein
MIARIIQVAGVGFLEESGTEFEQCHEFCDARYPHVAFHVDILRCYITDKHCWGHLAACTCQQLVDPIHHSAPGVDVGLHEERRITIAKQRDEILV